MKLNGIAIWAAFLLAGCAHSSVVLLPDEDGGHGEIPADAGTAAWI